LKGGKGRGREIDRKEEGKTKREGDWEKGKDEKKKSGR
jgi:hypothetical protein